jgi:hypothetical protein
VGALSPKTGEDVLGDIARLAKDLLPAPGADLLVKQVQR